ncbi:D-ribose pyranase [Isoptericola halotolerans]|uniref:D-ribose pyranase n=1 Tax=Isoptericola halotolerans TaxID=300560 RepID=A0ABX2A166_9MICO|nr:D-ribose pyranase [Isoptericola halotolerans]
MRRTGVLNPALAEGLARLGHGHLVVVADCGLPLPPSAPVVDLAVVHGVPRFTQVLDAVLEEIVVEGSVAATESSGTLVSTWLDERGLAPELVPHDELKELLTSAALVVRTGEATSYANVVLRCGVPF